MQEVVLTFSQRMRNAVAVGSDYGGHHLEVPAEIDYQPRRWTSEQGAAAVVAAGEEPHSGILE
jgi:hypothetical protein